MIELPIVDTHVHLWDPARLDYPWLDTVPTINRPFLLADYDAACRPYTVGRMVFVQCEADPAQYRQETQWITQLAAQDRRIGAIVSWAPLSKGEAARPELEQLAENRLVKGVREIIQFQSDPAWCLRPEMVCGVRMLAEFDLHYEICLKGAEQMASAIELVRRCPEVRFILDHIGKPMIAQGETEPWKSQLRQLAAMDNVWCKVSGLVVEADHERWTADQLRPYLDHVVDCFGLDRLMWGGDWPVVLLAAELQRWLEVADLWSRQFSGSQRRQLFCENALAFYGMTAEPLPPAA
jgi:L-fuconolactonase